MDHQTQGRSDVEQLAIKLGIYVGIFLAGALIAFVYSYVPLHSGKNWEIAYLEERLEAKEQALVQTTEDVARLESESAGKPDGETFKLLQKELATTDKTISNLENKLERSERRVKELERSRKNWQAKYKALEAKRLASVATQSPAPAATSGGFEETQAATPAAPASPAPSAQTDTLDGSAPVEQ